MIKAKQCYETPEAELLVVHFEGSLCQNPSVTGRREDYNYGNLDDYDEDYGD